MSFRIEEKLSIDNDKIIDFKSFLVNKTVKPIYQPRRIQSLYFDNQNYEMYTDSIEGLTPRKKIRVRNYPGTQDRNKYLEIKISSVEGRFKTRKIINQDKFSHIKKIGIYDNLYGTCRPIIYVIYDREYYQIGDVRISIDENIKYSLYTGRTLGYDQNPIVELKASIKKNTDDLINNFPFQRTRFSKYCNAFEKI